MANRGLTLFFIALIVSVAAYDVQAQDSRVQQRIERLERSINLLEREVYRNQPKEKKNFFGKTISRRGADDDKLTASSPNETLRLSELEESLRKLTGRLEELEFTLRRRAKERQSQDDGIAFRLSEVEKRLGITNATPVMPVSPVSSADEMPMSPAAPSGDGTKPLGAIALNPEAPPLPKTTKDEYDSAFSLLRQARYDDAASAFQEFIAEHPKDPLVSNAYYWLGETYYAREDYSKASIEFMNGYKTARQGQKAPDNLLKLAMSLGKFGKKEEACTTFKKLFKEYPKSSTTIRQRAKQERKALGCDL